MGCSFSGALFFLSFQQTYFLPKTTFYYTEQTEGIESVSGERLEDRTTQKFLHEGNLYILRNGHLFTPHGAQIR